VEKKGRAHGDGERRPSQCRVATDILRETKKKARTIINTILALRLIDSHYAQYRQRSTEIDYKRLRGGVLHESEELGSVQWAISGGRRALVY
jgi:hypothetical protein